MRPTLYYDVCLKSVRKENNNDYFSIDYQGKKIILPTESVYAEQYVRLLKENECKTTHLIGIARLIRLKNQETYRPRSFYCFDIYPDQTLRRAFDLDEFNDLKEPHNFNCIGWRNETHPDGFLVAKGIIPGLSGRFISDSTEQYPINIPFEFIEQCSRIREDPVSVIRNFIADVCRLQNTPEIPRADKFKSLGIEAEKKALEYIKQAYNLKKVDD